MAAGVIDPVKVVRSALQNAASVSSLLLTTEAMIAGHGLDNLQARLKTLFGDQAALDIQREEPFTIVSISLPRNSQAEMVEP